MDTEQTRSQGFFSEWEYALGASLEYWHNLFVLSSLRTAHSLQEK